MPTPSCLCTKPWWADRGGLFCCPRDRGWPGRWKRRGTAQSVSPATLPPSRHSPLTGHYTQLIPRKAKPGEQLIISRSWIIEYLQQRSINPGETNKKNITKKRNEAVHNSLGVFWEFYHTQWKRQQLQHKSPHTGSAPTLNIVTYLNLETPNTIIRNKHRWQKNRSTVSKLIWASDPSSALFWQASLDWMSQSTSLATKHQNFRI